VERVDAVGFHHGRAAEWELLYQRPSFQMRRRVIMTLLGPHLRQGARWLDAGCGSGYLSREMARSGATVVGVDAAAGMVAESVARAAGEPSAGQMSFQQVDSIERLPFGDASFDGVLCSSVIEYVPDYAQAIRELGRVLRPGGVVVLTVPNRTAVTRILERAVFALTSRVLKKPWPRYRRHSRWQFSVPMMRAELAASGLKLQDVGYFGNARPVWLNRYPAWGMLFAALAVKE
jgi:2-polyprenyl-3-methyl-5-hydroxy-6-metoxy-1,4-benzoquinol methylase